MIGDAKDKNANQEKRKLLPTEVFELNWRIWGFVLIAVLGVYLMTLYPVSYNPKTGLTDPFYSPTVLVIPFIALFRLTCYAYRKDYHRHLFNHPRSCEIGFRGEYKGRPYTGETSILLRLENYHRYFVYFAIAILPFFYYDIYLSFVYQGGFTLTLGAVLLIINTLLVTVYTFSCHAVRHLIGGNVDCYSCQHQTRRKLFNGQTRINNHHETYAWLSLSMFFLVDLYIRATSAGVIHSIVLLHL